MSLRCNALTASAAPHFGWQAAGHSALRQGAASGVADPQWRTYLAENEPAIGYYDAAQDEQHKGPWHFVDLEYTSNWTKGPKLSWKELFTQWSPTQQAKIQQQWQAKPLTEGQLPTGPTVFDGVIESFNSALRALSTEHEIHDTHAANATHHATIASLGALNHYVSDLHMPLHSTAAFTWPVMPPWAGSPAAQKAVNAKVNTAPDMHAFIEGDLFTATELTAITQQAKQHPAPQLTLQTLKPYLLQQIMASYLTCFQIFQAQQQVLGALPNAIVQPEAYVAYLKAALKPIIAPRLIAGQQTLTAIQNLLWQEAKRLEQQRKSAEPTGMAG